MIPFQTPSRSDAYDVMGAMAARSTLADAGIDHADAQQPMRATSTATARPVRRSSTRLATRECPG